MAALRPADSPAAVNATKSITGHGLTAAGPSQAAASCCRCGTGGCTRRATSPHPSTTPRAGCAGNPSTPTSALPEPEHGLRRHQHRTVPERVRHSRAEQRTPCPASVSKR
ncbi:hypothetical protein LV779_34355 [Streptomyces thinghirensis]|nr:hypothetical protein [Streptomyces thinghirensis]